MDRGRLARRFALGTLVSALVALASAGAAQAVVLYEQMTPLEEPPDVFSSDVYAVPDIDHFTQQYADDFTVPAGQTWTISQVDVAGLNGGAGPSTTNVNVSLLATDPGDPDIPVDPPLFQQLNTATSGTPNYVVALTGAPALGPGHYWVSVQALGASYDANLQQSNFWGWRLLDIQGDGIGSQPAVKMQDPGDPMRCPTWTTLVGCVDTGTRNLAFRLHAVDPNADLAIDKSTKTDFVRPGEVVAYKIRVSNPGVADAVGVKVCDRLPPDHTALRAKGASLKKKRKVCWELDRLAAGADRVFKITTQVSLNSPAKRQRNTAVASAENVEDKPQDDAVVQLRGVPDTCARSAKPIQPQPYC